MSPQLLSSLPFRSTFIAVLVAFAVAPSLPFSDNASAQAATTSTFTAFADTYASGAEPDRNFGTSTSIRTDASPDLRSFIRFDPDGLSGSISQARLRVFANSSNATGIDVRGVTSSSWGETTLTYRNMPGTLGVTSSSGPISTGTWVEWNVTSLVSNNDPVSFALTSTSSTATNLASRESSNKPQLTVTFESGPTPLPSISPSPIPTTSPSPTPPPGSGGTVIAAAGDIACDPASSSFKGGDGTPTRCRMKYTADLLAGAAAVLPLGDNQYEEGSLSQFRQSYDLSWGRYKSVTHPSVGNHEYLTPGAAGYFDYFGAAAGSRTQGWYSFNIAGWHLVALNSQCSKVGGCGVGSPQYEWLKADLAANNAACTLAYWHIPRFAHGQFSNSTTYQPFWQLLYDDGAEIVLVGHDHNYQRYAPQTPTGGLDHARGIRQFIVGTGGKNLVVPDSTGMNREAANGDTHGVLKLTLRSTSYDWRFTPEAGKTYTDSGTNSCH